MSEVSFLVQGQSWAWQFRFGFRQLRSAYKAAREVTDRQIDQLEKDWNVLEASINAGEASLVEEDEYGNVTFDRGEHAGEMMREAEIVLGLVRETFAIALHHFWERQLNGKLKA